MKFFEHDDFEGEALKNFTEANDLRTQNAELAAKVESLAGSNLDLAGAKIDYFMVALTQAGVISKDQYAEIVVGWELHVQAQLTDYYKELERRHKQAIRQQQVQRSQQLATPRKGIIIPGKGIHEVPDKEN